MNLLIVDDEELEVEIIQEMIDKKRFDIEEIYLAYSMEQAIEMLESHNISILLSDIEMPRGSGHELVEWIKEKELPVFSAFLTSHAQFHYAQEAIRLGVWDYILKPVMPEDLEKCLQKLCGQYKLKVQSEKNKQYAEYWNNGKFLVKQDFWRSLLLKKQNQVEDIAKKYKQFGMQLQSNNWVYPILIAIKQKKEIVSLWSESDMEFALKNIVLEILGEYTDAGNVLYEEGKLFIICETQKDMDTILQSKCDILIKYCCEFFDFCTMNLFIDHVVSMEELNETVCGLDYACRNCLTYTNDVIKVGELGKAQMEYEKPDVEMWIAMLLSNETQMGMEEIHNYLDTIKNRIVDNRFTLQIFQQDFLQEFYIALEKRGIQANAIFREEKMVQLFQRAADSEKDMENWITNLVEETQAFKTQIKNEPTIIERAKEYIANNYQNDLNRNDIASAVYLNPDYFSRIFKEKEGISVSDYIIKIRLENAKQRLLTTNQSISDIALSIGYSNTGYFTSSFRRATGVTPKEYRRLGGVV